MRYGKPEVILIDAAFSVIQGSPPGSKNSQTIDSFPNHVTATAYEADE